MTANVPPEVQAERHAEWVEGDLTARGVAYSNDGQAITSQNYKDLCACKHTRTQHRMKCAGRVGKFWCNCAQFVLAERKMA